MSAKENPKHTQIVTTAHSLFMKHGIHRVSVEEICQEAGVSKMTFYKHFKNKIELAKYIINKIITEAENKYKDLMARDIPYSEKVKLMIQLKMEGTKNLSREFMTEISRNADPEISDLYNSKAQEMFQALMQDFIQAQKKGEVREDIKPEFILYFLNHMIDLANDPQLINLYESAPDLIIELTNFYFYGIMPREEANEKK
ncbi:TetR/AcrR family transcriptional regulator [bacterium]